MTTHTYAGYTAEQIRSAAEAATQGKWRALGYRSNGREAIGVVDGIGRFIAERVTASGMMGFSGTDAVHIATSCPTTVLALLDRIAELELRAVAAEGWHLIETGRADELQANVNLNRDEIAGLRARIAELEPDAARWSAIISGDLEGLTLFAHNADWTNLDPLVGLTADAAIDAARDQQKNPAAP